MTILLYGYILLFLVLLLLLFKRGGSIVSKFQNKPQVNNTCLYIRKPNYR